MNSEETKRKDGSGENGFRHRRDPAKDGSSKSGDLLSSAELVSVSDGEDDVTAPLLPSAKKLVQDDTETKDRTNSKSSLSKRLDCIDCFRGICMFNMILGDYAYGVTPWFHHSPWQGMTFDDPTFPSFVFVMGVGIGLSMDRMRQKNLKDMIVFVWRRAFTLVFLNFVFQGWYQGWYIDHVRIPGVLFRLGWCYGIVGTLCVWLPTFPRAKWTRWIRQNILGGVDKKRDDGESHLVLRVANLFRDVIELTPQWLGVGFVYSVWFLLTYFLPVPCGGGRDLPDPDNGEPVIGYTGPGGIADDDYYYWCSGGASAYVDRLVFSERHVQEPRLVHCMEEPSIMCPRPVDDLGVLGTLAACVTTMLGVQSAITFRRILSRDTADGTLESLIAQVGSVLCRWMGLSVILGIAATVMCSGCNWFDWTDDPSVRFGWIPIIKITWTPSFICAMASIDLFVLSLLFVLIDLPALLRNQRAEQEMIRARQKLPPTYSASTSINQSKSNAANGGGEGSKRAEDTMRWTSQCANHCWWRGQPFRSFGRNAILFYMLCLMAASWIPIIKPQFFMLDVFTPFQKVTTGIAGVGVWMVCAYYLDEIGWYWVVGREPFNCDRALCGIPSKVSEILNAMLQKNDRSAKGGRSVLGDDDEAAV